MSPENSDILRRTSASVSIRGGGCRPVLFYRRLLGGQYWRLSSCYYQPCLAHCVVLMVETCLAYCLSSLLSHLAAGLQITEEWHSYLCRHLNGFEDRPPVRPNISLGDTLAGLHAAFGVVMALLHRQRHNNKVPGQVKEAARIAPVKKYAGTLMILLESEANLQIAKLPWWGRVR